jgi:hypothetical protein
MSQQLYYFNIGRYGGRVNARRCKFSTVNVLGADTQDYFLAVIINKG